MRCFVCLLMLLAPPVWSATAEDLLTAANAAVPADEQFSGSPVQRSPKVFW